MKGNRKNMWMTLLRFAPLLICAVCMGVYLFSGKDFSAEGLAALVPPEPFWAALFMIALYAFKSLTIMFPIVVLNVLGGFLFSPWTALLVNSIGLLAELAIPYTIGRWCGADYVSRLRRKYPKLDELIQNRPHNRMFAVFFLRIIACLPEDAISMYFGASKTPFLPYMLLSFLGTLPSLAAATLLGSSISNPASPRFWIAAVLTVGMAVVSFVIYGVWCKMKKRKEDAS